MIDPPFIDPSLAVRLCQGDRRALAQAITLVESTRADHRLAAEALIAALMPQTGRSIRIGISGVPGVGKSTFIETFGLHLIGRGHRIAVLAVDPSSQRTGGSILGDKTRMAELTRHPAAFIRPSPSGGTLGGVARRTREAMLLCEAAGHDVIIVETVGVGQSETAVADMVDLFMLLLLPGGGDELQGIKKGIVELADLIVVNKADGDLMAAARQAVADYRHALTLLRAGRAGWRVPVLSGSAITGQGIDAIWDEIAAFADAMRAGGHFEARRAEQARSWLWSEILGNLEAAFRSDPAVAADLSRDEAAVIAGRVAPPTAARALLARFLAPREMGSSEKKSQ
ncbi:MAG: methylmalonyl Co-A mutase-associated GTPase MeaB [Azospirillaceae bacterium]|nr:methylmalonyl Co-A mutase-associated GTPase MeaB [Azospirillaceae bacterium]